MEAGPEVAFIQEVHWHADSLAKEKVALAKLGYEVYSQPSPVRKQPVGGCAVMVKAHLKGTFIHRFQHPTTGCGFEAVMVRFAGTNVVCVSIYLQSGHFIDGAINAKILAELKSMLATLRCPWFVAGDWNSSLPEVPGTRLNEVLKGQFLGTGHGTAGGENELDFALIHPALHHFVHVSPDWTVPFKPHCALNFYWQAEAIKDLVPGLTVCADDFHQITSEQRLEVFPVTSPGSVQILEFQVDDPVSIQCAAFSATAENSGFLGSHRGRGASCQTRRAVRMGNPVKPCLWHGKEHSFWSRWESWLSAQSMPPRRVLVQSLDQCPDEDWKCRCQEWLQQPHQDALTKDVLLRQAAKAAIVSKKTQAEKEKEDFMAWILGAGKAGLGPVYKAIKNPEQTTLRTYRDKSLLCRAYLRMEFWAMEPCLRFRRNHRRPELALRLRPCYKQKCSLP